MLVIAMFKFAIKCFFKREKAMFVQSKKRKKKERKREKKSYVCQRLTKKEDSG